MDKKFGDFLRNVRENAGFESQRSLSVSAGLSNATIARIENGEQEPKPETLRRLSEPLKIPYERLMREAGYLDSEDSQTPA